MAENTNIAEADFSMAVNNDAVYLLSQEFERDSRRYNRAFTEQQEVSTK